MRPSPYPLDTLLELWADEELTADQIIEHMLRHMLELEKQIKELERQLRQVSGSSRNRS